MADFKFLNYHTEYEVHGTSNKKMAPEACFAHVFQGPKYMENVYKILIYRGLNQAKKGEDNNCFLNKNQLFHHISILKKLYGFSFNIEEKVTKKLLPYFELNLVIKGHNLIHRFILTWVRYAYEFPYNLYILDVYRLKKEEIFKHVNAINLFNLVSSCMNSGNGGHMFTDPGTPVKILKFNGLKNRLNTLTKYDYPRLEQVFTTTRYLNWNKKPVSPEELYIFENWEATYEKRIPLYIEEYQKNKKL